MFYSKSFTQVYIHEWPADALKNPLRLALYKRVVSSGSEYISMKILLTSSSSLQKYKKTTGSSPHLLLHN